MKTAILSTLGDRGSALAAQQVTVLLLLAARLLPDQHLTVYVTQPVTFSVPSVRQASIAPSASMHLELSAAALRGNFCSEPSHPALLLPCQ